MTENVKNSIFDVKVPCEFSFLLPAVLLLKWTINSSNSSKVPCHCYEIRLIWNIESFYSS